MKTVLTLILSLFVMNAVAAEKTLVAQDAQDLLQALLQSGVELTETADGFKTLEPVTISCKVSREHQYSGGVLLNSPVCFQHATRTDDYHFSFDKELRNPAALLSALEKAGAETDGAMGTYYAFAKNISCELNFSPRTSKCTLETNN